MNHPPEPSPTTPRRNHLPRPAVWRMWFMSEGWILVAEAALATAADALSIAYELGISLTPMEAADITWHMGAFGLGERELKAYKTSINRFPSEIILTHAADHLASVMEGKKAD